MPTRPARLQLAMGTADAPDSPFGRDELDVAGDGAVVYRNQLRDATRTTTARLTPAARDKLFALFEASPFPASPSAQLAPGATACELVADGVRMRFGYHAGRKAPGYAELVRLLDGWATVLRGPADQRAASADLVDIVDA
jgi:hypothetical protein